MPSENQIRDESLAQVGSESLRYHPSKVSWAISQHISRENPLYHRAFVYLLVGIIGVALTYSALTKVAVSVKSTGVLDYPSSSVQVINPQDFTLEKVWVANRARVKRGEVVMTARNALSTEVTSSLRHHAEKVLKLAKADEAQNCRSKCFGELEMLSQKGFSFLPGLTVEGPFQEYLGNVSNILRGYVNDLKNSESAPAALAGIRLRLKDTERKLGAIERNKARRLLAMEYATLKKEAADLKAQLSEREEANRRQLFSSRSGLVVELQKFEKQLREYDEAHTLRAPVDGEVVLQNVAGVGAFVSARTLLFQVVPVESELVARLQVSNKDVAQIRVGDRVKLSLDALNERDFGTAEGVVSVIPGSASVENGSRYFDVVVELDQQHLTSQDNEKREFRAGMTLNAKIVARYRSLLRLGLSKLLNLKEEYLGD